MRQMGIVVQCRSKVCSATITPSSSTAAVGGSDNELGSISSSRRFHDDVHCCGLSKLVTKLIHSKKESWIRIRISNLSRRKTSTRSRQSTSSSFKCRYDPSSYSLNFDSSTSTSNNGLSSEDDDYYYQFCAFSSRFAAAAPRTAAAASSSPAFSSRSIDLEHKVIY